MRPNQVILPSIASVRRGRSAWTRRAACAVALAFALTSAGASADDASATERLFAAVHASDLAAVQTTLAAGASLEATDRWGMTALELAVDKGYYHIAHYLTAARNFREPGTTGSGAQAAAAGEPKEGKVPAASVRPAHAPQAANAPRAANATAGTKAARAAAVPSVGDAPVAAWPADKPNPFDPAVPAFGSVPLVVGETGAPPVEQVSLDGGS
jgi:hypothetical protein